MTATTQARAALSGANSSLIGTNLLGTYAEDYAFYGDLTNSVTGQNYVMGTNTFDLDEYNGRYCVTPEFPTLHYAYFLDIDASANSAYPYAIAFEYYGTASGGSVSSISEPVTTNFNGQADSALTIGTPAVTNSIVTLTWSSTEGGTYVVESSTDNSNWSVQRTNVSASVGVSTSTIYTNSTSTGTAYARVTRTALATYDPTGGGSGVVAQTNIISFSLGNGGTNTPGTAATLSTASYSGGNFVFAVSGTTGASYVVQSTTNVSLRSWVPVYTNTSPFNYTNKPASLYIQQYFRAVASQ